ncbi:MAG TPA: hypothetical protein VIF15_00515 [Polyangiaceae bacterium]|jgi:hypothetical protein
MRVFPCAGLVLAVACGARTQLEVTPEDALADASAPDALPDAVPDVHRQDCAEAGVTYVYVIMADSHLAYFDPASDTFNPIAPLDCPAAPGDSPNSMAVDRQGTAYVSYHDGSLFRVDTRTAGCSPTGFVPGQGGWRSYGMGFTTQGAGPAETLYVAESSYAQPSRGLATIDVRSYAFGFVGAFSPALGSAVELSGTGDGRLFAFSVDSPGPGSHLVEVDPAGARVLSSTSLPVGSPSAGFAFAYWGGDFYVFLSGAGGLPPTTVSRWRPADGSLTTVATSPSIVVGAGVSTCAPQ